jgi:predicted dehydrogenase
MLRWWFGTPGALFARVETLMPDRIDPETGTAWTATADDFVHLLTRHPTCPHADVRITGVTRQASPESTIVHGTEGTLVLHHGVRERLWLARGEGPPAEITVDDPDEALEGIEPGSWSGHVLRMLRETVAAIRDDRAVTEGATFADGVVTQVLLDAARASHADGCWTTVGVPT